MARDALKDSQNPEEGSIEAGLTMIPTTAFFLMVMQLVISGSFQLAETIDLQSTLSRTALFGSEGSEFFFERPRSLQQKSVEMPGGGELLMARSTTSTPIISALAPNNISTWSDVVVVRE